MQNGEIVNSAGLSSVRHDKARLRTAAIARRVLGLSLFRYVSLFFVTCRWESVVDCGADGECRRRRRNTRPRCGLCALPSGDLRALSTNSDGQCEWPANEGFIAADFEHAASGIRYRIAQESGQVWLSYERNDDARRLDGRQELRYFVGSGRRGRTYLFEQEGYWFEAPINWYAKKQVWDMAPHYLEAREMPLSLPVDPGCLHCHASGVGCGVAGCAQSLRGRAI